MAYLDHAATTDVLPAALAAFNAAVDAGGNPSSTHAAGRAARRLVEESREAIARALGALPSEVVFTSGGTESDNLAVKGIFWQRHGADPRRVRIITSRTEHHAVTEPAEWLGQAGPAELEYVQVDASGRVDLADLAARVGADPGSVALISLMWANNETGVIQPVAEIVQLAAAHGIPVHSDGVQAVGHLPVDFAAVGLAALSFSGHKLGAPTGIGGLLLKRNLQPTPILHGGGQERDVRSGTIPTGLIAALAAAVTAAVADRTERCREVAALRDELVQGVLKVVPDAIHTAAAADRLPGIAHFVLPGCEGNTVAMLLDDAGVYASAGSACAAGVHRPSHALSGMGIADDLAIGSIRFSLGRSSTAADVAELLAALPEAVQLARAARLAGSGSL